MESLYLLIPLSIVFAFIIGISFWWSVKSGQFDDLEGPAYRILMDDDSASNEQETNEHSDNKNTTPPSPKTHNKS